jgi:glycosyltransferase involved in cell wall biosynthesis
VVPTKVDALARELDEWLGNEPRRRDAAERARPFVWRNYDWNEIARRWGQRYADLVRRT